MIFKIDLENRKFLLLKKFENFKSNITIMDFSINNVHFLYKENSDEPKVFNLMASRFENALNIHKDGSIDWMQDGLLVSQEYDVFLYIYFWFFVYVFDLLVLDAIFDFFVYLRTYLLIITLFCV